MPHEQCVSGLLFYSTIGFLLSCFYSFQFVVSYRIDWEEEGPSFHGYPDDSSDEEYLPKISLR